MWSYYGCKTKLVDLYPSPRFKRIIEPFAGSARYSLKYWQHDIILIDKYKVISDLWKWLQLQSEKYILSLPNFEKGDDLRKTKLCKQAKYLIGFSVNRGCVLPANIASNYNYWHRDKIKIANNLHKIRHWKIINGSYNAARNQKATWFIDPPYQYGGQYYRESNKNIDYQKLGHWCASRSGQSIVCENSKAKWMDFHFMKKFKGMQKKRTTECIWSNLKTGYENQQKSLFENKDCQEG